MHLRASKYAADVRDDIRRKFGITDWYPSNRSDSVVFVGSNGGVIEIPTESVLRRIGRHEVMRIAAAELSLSLARGIPQQLYFQLDFDKQQRLRRCWFCELYFSTNYLVRMSEERSDNEHVEGWVCHRCDQ
jgi:hypothetical protein